MKTIQDLANLAAVLDKVFALMQNQNVVGRDTFKQLQEKEKQFTKLFINGCLNWNEENEKPLMIATSFFPDLDITPSPGEEGYVQRYLQEQLKKQKNKSEEKVNRTLNESKTDFLEEDKHFVGGPPFIKETDETNSKQEKQVLQRASVKLNSNADDFAQETPAVQESQEKEEKKVLDNSAQSDQIDPDYEEHQRFLAEEKKKIAAKKAKSKRITRNTSNEGRE